MLLVLACTKTTNWSGSRSVRNGIDFARDKYVLHYACIIHVQTCEVDDDRLNKTTYQRFLHQLFVRFAELFLPYTPLPVNGPVCINCSVKNYHKNIYKLVIEK